MALTQDDLQAIALLLEPINDRLGNLEKGQRDTNMRINALQGSMDERIGALQGSMDERIGALRDSVDERFGTLFSTLRDTNMRIDTLQDSMDERFDLVDKKLDLLESSVNYAAKDSNASIRRHEREFHNVG